MTARDNTPKGDADSDPGMLTPNIGWNGLACPGPVMLGPFLGIDLTMAGAVSLALAKSATPESDDPAWTAPPRCGLTGPGDGGESGACPNISRGF